MHFFPDVCIVLNRSSDTSAVIITPIGQRERLLAGCDNEDCRSQLSSFGLDYRVDQQPIPNRLLVSQQGLCRVLDFGV